MELRLVDEYMMLLQTQNGGKVIVDTRPVLQVQAKLTLQQVVKMLEYLDAEFPLDIEFGFVVRGKINELKEASK